MGPCRVPCLLPRSSREEHAQCAFISQLHLLAPARLFVGPCLVNASFLPTNNPLRCLRRRAPATFSRRSQFDANHAPTCSGVATRRVYLSTRIEMFSRGSQNRALPPARRARTCNSRGPSAAPPPETPPQKIVEPARLAHSQSETRPTARPYSPGICLGNLPLPDVRRQMFCPKPATARTTKSSDAATRRSALTDRKFDLARAQGDVPGVRGLRLPWLRGVLT